MLENKKAFNGKLCMWIGALYSQVIEATLYLLHQLIGTYKYAQNIGIEKHVTSHTMRHSHYYRNWVFHCVRLWNV